MTAKIEERGEIAAKLAATIAYTPYILRVILGLIISFNDDRALHEIFMIRKPSFDLKIFQIVQDFGADPGEACIKSQDYIGSR